MKRFLFFAFLLWAGLLLWSSTASASTVWSYSSGGCGNTFNPCEQSLAELEAYARAQGTPDLYECRSARPNDICFFSTPPRSWQVSANESNWTYTVSYSATNPCGTGQEVNNETGECSAPVENPSTCLENGEYWQESTSSCVTSCPNGSLDHYCLEQAPVGEPDTDESGNECTPASADYQGIFAGKHYCDSNLPEPASCPSGQMAVIQLDHSGSGAFVCGEPITSPENAGDTETESTTTTTDAEGNTTTTTTDDAGNTTTTTTDSAGNSTTINNYPGIDSETGGPCTAASVACIPTPETEKGICKDGGSLCDDVNKIKDAITKEHTREAKTGKFDDEAANTAVATAETELTNGLNQIKAEIGGYFDLALSAGDMACGPGVDVLGTTIQICPSEMKEELSVIAQIVMLIAGLISLMIVFR